MNSIQLKTRGGAEALVYDAAEKPRAGAGEILVRVMAAAVTPTELVWVPTWTTMDGQPRPFPIIPGHEFSGVVDSVGAEVSAFSPGQAVFGMNDWFANGAQAEFCRARVVDVAEKPSSVDHVTAAMVPISSLTAWQGLIDRAKLKRGERVLIHGAAGSVGLFAVQIARLTGAHVIATASEHNIEFVRGLGADEVIDYRAKPFEHVVRDVDVVFDTVGGDTLARSWDVLSSGGRMVTIAANAEQTHEQRVKDAFFIVNGSGQELARVAQLIDGGQLRPVVDSVFSLSQARLAYERKPVRGKVVIEIATE